MMEKYKLMVSSIKYLHIEYRLLLFLATAAGKFLGNGINGCGGGLTALQIISLDTQELCNSINICSSIPSSLNNSFELCIVSSITCLYSSSLNKQIIFYWYKNKYF